MSYQSYKTGTRKKYLEEKQDLREQLESNFSSSVENELYRFDQDWDDYFYDDNSYKDNSYDNNSYKDNFDYDYYYEDKYYNDYYYDNYGYYDDDYDDKYDDYSVDSWIYNDYYDDYTNPYNVLIKETAKNVLDILGIDIEKLTLDMQKKLLTLTVDDIRKFSDIIQNMVERKQILA